MGLPSQEEQEAFSLQPVESSTARKAQSINTALKYIRNLQLRLLFAAFKRRLPPWLIRFQSAYIYELRAPFTLQEGESHSHFEEGYRFSELPPTIASQCSQLSGVALSTLTRRWQFGDRCFGVFCPDNTLVHVCWVHLGPCYVRGLGLQLDLSPKDCYVYGVFTDPLHRGKSIYRRAQQSLLDILESDKTLKAIQLVEAENRVPPRVLPTLGYKTLWWVQHRVFLGLKYTTVRTMNGKLIERQFRIQPPKDHFVI